MVLWSIFIPMSDICYLSDLCVAHMFDQLPCRYTLCIVLLYLLVSEHSNVIATYIHSSVVMQDLACIHL
jgi:hypothetical protein